MTYRNAYAVPFESNYQRLQRQFDADLPRHVVLSVMLDVANEQGAALSIAAADRP